MIKKTILFLFAFLAFASLNAQTVVDNLTTKHHRPQGLPSPTTVTFSQVNDTTPLLMDIYYPEHRRPDSTVVVYFFGGGFFSGARDSSSALYAVDALLKQGYVAVSVDYRLGLRMVNFDTVKVSRITNVFYYSINMAVEDCSQAVQYLVRHSRDLGLKPEKMVLTGSSAGAITVLQTDYCRCNDLPQASALPQGWKPLAVIPYSGAVLCHKGDMHYRQTPAPTCFFHGTYDKIVNYNRFRSTGRNILYGSNQLAKVFQKNRYPYWIMRFQDRGHEVSVYLPNTIQEFNAFVETALAQRVTFYDATCEDAALKESPYSHFNIFNLYFGGGKSRKK